MKNICLASIPAPWFFGPYAKQLYLLITEMIKIKPDYTIYYLCLGFDLKKQIYTYTEVLENFDNDNNNNNNNNDVTDNDYKNKNKKSSDISNKKETLEKIKFIGGIEKINGGYTVSSFNAVMSYFNIDCLITCMDLVSYINDEYFKIKSLSWFPNHFQPIRKFDLSRLQLFSHIISLCPTDTKLLKKSLSNKKVSYIPHIIDFQVSSEEIDKYKLRLKYNIPLDSFVVLINAGNYEIQNRKSFDTSIFAFEKFVNKRKNAFLYIHSFNAKSVNDKNKFISSTSSMFNIKDLIDQTGIPINRIKLNEELLSDNEIIELMQISDVLLQSSKSEGFGVPILESQLVGLPVITTKFGAMDDYTYYGISVEPLQKMYEPSASGIWVLPSIEGIYNALLSIANYEIEDKKEYAKKTIMKLMSAETVCNSFIKIIEEPFDINEHNVISLSSPNFMPISHIIYDNKSNSFYIDQEKCSSIDSNKLNKDWILFTDNKVTVNFDLIQNILMSIKSDNPTDLILFKTRFNNNIYPNVEDINQNNPNIDFNKMYYCIKKKFFNSFINNVTIENKYMREFILRNAVNRCKVSLADEIVMIEISSNNDVKGTTVNNFVNKTNKLKELNNNINENLVIELSNGNLYKSLEEMVDNSRTDKNTIHSYLPLYQKLLISKKETAKNVLEVGIYKGGSIKLWSDFFTNAKVYGLDIINIRDIWEGIKNKENIILHTSCDAYNIDFFTNNFLNKNIKCDFMLDDGPHTLESMKQFINLYSQIMTDDGILIIEDVQMWDWIDILKNEVPENLKQFIKVYDLRKNKNRYDDIVFTIDKSNSST